MPNKKNNITTQDVEEIDISKIDASLNFAYCPSKALTINAEAVRATDEFKELSLDLDEQSKSYLEKALRYFYICYCIKLENDDQNFENKNYFYFQLFSQVGDQQSASQPIYGFYYEGEILDLIKDIDQLFESKDYDKYVFDTFHSDFFGKAGQLVELMQNWTSSKLIEFNYSYINDELAVKNLQRLIEKEKIKKTNARKKSPIKRKKISTKSKSKTNDDKKTKRRRNEQEK